MNKLLLSILLLLLAVPGFAQSGRRGDPDAVKLETDGLKAFSVAALFSKANNYSNEQFTRFEEEKTPYTQSLHRRVLAEQKQLAAKYGNHAKTREKLSDDDYYYLGRLHWMATNSTDAADAFEKFIEKRNGTAQKMQTSRAVLVVISSDGKKFEKAERYLADYYKNEPTKLSEIAKMEKQLAHMYQQEKRFEEAAPHAEKVFAASQKLLPTDQSRAGALNRLMDAGITTFQIHKALGNREKAEITLLKLRDQSIPVQSHSVYFKAMDEMMKYLLITGRRLEADALYKDIFRRIPADFKSKSQEGFVRRKFKKRKQHYKILGAPAPELVAIDHWLPNRPQPISELSGKVILLDFWATWCGPCLKAFPSLSEWHESYKDAGLVILGVTRFYGQGNSDDMDKPKEVDYLTRFKKTHNLPYGFAIADGQANQYLYGATGLPTAVLIDRKGIVRYVESGASETREKELLKFIKKLLAEK